MTALEHPLTAGSTTAERVHPSSRWRWVVASALGTAGVLHIAAAITNGGAGAPAVAFFVLTALVQLGVAAWLEASGGVGPAPGKGLLLTTLIGTVCLVLLYLTAHTTGWFDAFTAPSAGAGDAGTSGTAGMAGHPAGPSTSSVDPATGVDLSAGMSATMTGPVAMDTDGSVQVERGAGLLGTTTVAAELLAVAALAALLPSSWRRRVLDGLLVLGVLAWALWFTGVLA